MTFIIAAAVVWLLCACLTYGINFGYFQREFAGIAEITRRSDMAMAMAFGLFLGPLGLLVSFFLSGFCQHGLKFK
jgi:hypothetical protein